MHLDLLARLGLQIDVMPLDWLNIALAVLCVLIAFGAINRMTAQTESTIIFAFVTVMVGCFGYAMGSVLEQHWQKVFDTLLLGGVASLLIGTRKQTIWVSPDWMPRLSLGVSLFTWAVFFGAVS